MRDKETVDTFAFTTSNEGIAFHLTNQVTIVNGERGTQVLALWDTGASGTCIAKEIVKLLNLVPTGKRNIQTPSGTSVVNTYLVNIILPNNVRVKDVEVCDSEIGNQGIGVLIGMDIIMLGDFAVSGFAGKTSFSFRIPSMAKTDYVKELNIKNIIGNKHGKGKRKK